MVTWRTGSTLDLRRAAVARRLSGRRHAGGIELRVIVHAVFRAVQRRAVAVRSQVGRRVARLPHLRPRRVLLRKEPDLNLNRKKNRKKC